MQYPIHPFNYIHPLLPPSFFPPRILELVFLYKRKKRYIKAAKLILLLPRLKEQQQQQLIHVLSMLDDITKRTEIARSRSRVIL